MRYALFTRDSQSESLSCLLALEEDGYRVYVFPLYCLQKGRSIPNLNYIMCEVSDSAPFWEQCRSVDYMLPVAVSLNGKEALVFL